MEETKVINSEEMQTIAAGRAKTYAVLAALYTTPPSEELAAMIRAGGLAPEGSGALGAAANELTEFFRQAASEGYSGNELVAEHTRLFVLPSGVVPHESFYLDENKRVGGHVTSGVQRYYEAAAARHSSTCLELPDHVGVELDFMKFLCDVEEQFWKEPNWDGVQKCLELENGFLAGHLLRWHRALCEKILVETNLDIYRALARLTIEFLDAERGLVPALTAEIVSEWRTACVSES